MRILIRCFGAASAKDRLDVSVRDAINAGNFPGPRSLANAKEIAVPDGDLVPGITAYASGPEEMREVVRRHATFGVDQIKISMSGEEVCLFFFCVCKAAAGHNKLTHQ